VSLIIYSDIESVKADKKDLILVNDSFFDTNTVLQDNTLVREVLSKVDKAEYNTDLTFRSRTKEMGALNKNNLSTGTKTILNILEHKDKCFSVSECGNNVLCFIPQIKEGCIYWDIPAVAYTGCPDCDIQYKGKNYTDFYEFLESVGD
jgi:hypothetical protein